ncbi:hypothetical protein V2J09_018445 [Rumex salicifolius]
MAATKLDLSDPHESLSESTWEPLDADVTELILYHLPIRSIVLAAAACKPWRSLASSTTFSSRVSASKKPWFFLYGLNNIFPKNNQGFAFDPESHEWLLLPPSLVPTPFSQEQSFIGSGGFFFSTTVSSAASFCFSPILKRSWKHTSPLKFSRCNPVVGAFLDGDGAQRFIVVGGVRFIGGLVDIEDRLAVEIYNPNLDAWELCPPLPAAFRPGHSSQSLSSALFKGKFYIFGIYSCLVSAFDLSSLCWSKVQTLRPSGVVSSFLISCQDHLVLAGLCNNLLIGPSVILWKVDETTMEYSEMAVMPRDLLHCLFDKEEDDRFASLKCVGQGNLIYVFNEEHHKCYPACFCEITTGLDGVIRCSWIRVPPLTSPVNSFHKVISFCSTISLADILQTQT